MPEREKIRELAKKLVAGFLGGAHFVSKNTEGQFMADAAYNLLRFDLTEQCESFLRAELEPLLKAAQTAVRYHNNLDEHQCSSCPLAAELKGWRSGQET